MHLFVFIDESTTALGEFPLSVGSAIYDIADGDGETPPQNHTTTVNHPVPSEGQRVVVFVRTTGDLLFDFRNTE